MHFGIRFSHSSAITTNYIPHGRAHLIPISWNGRTIGGLHIRGFPPLNDEEFIATGKAHFTKEFKATSVDHRLYETPGKYKFHVFTIRMTKEGTDHIIEHFMHLKRSKPTTLAEEIMASNFGSFEFQFFSPAADFPALKPEIQTMIDTFKLE